jgi:phage terminase small subunit
MTLTIKQENFCIAVAKGKNQTEAYREYYNTKNMKDETIWNSAYKLMNNGEVAAKIAELRARMEEKLVYSAKQSFENFEELKRMAIMKNNVQAALKAEELKGKLAGLYVDKQEVAIEGVKKVLVEFEE